MLYIAAVSDLRARKATAQNPHKTMLAVYHRRAALSPHGHRLDLHLILVRPHTEARSITRRMQLFAIKTFIGHHFSSGITDNRKIIGDVRRTGCPALDLAWVAAGKFDAFVSDPLDYAEIAAGELLVREAGGKIIMGADLIATNGHVEL